MGANRFFVNKIGPGPAVISGEDFGHITKVLRLKEGDEVNIFNYEHGEFTAVIEHVDHSAGTVSVAVKENIRERERKGVKISAIIALIKKDKMEFTLEKLTELGIDRIIPLVTKRSVVKVKEEEKKLKRWESIIYAAVKQCGRLSAPELLPVVESAEEIEAPQDALKYFIYEKEDARFLIDEAVKIPGDVTEVFFVIGPEGGFDDSEAGVIIKKGFIPVSIGDTILRAETAAIAAGTVLVQALRRSKWKN